MAVQLLNVQVSQQLKLQIDLECLFWDSTFNIILLSSKSTSNTHMKSITLYKKIRSEDRSKNHISLFGTVDQQIKA